MTAKGIKIITKAANQKIEDHVIDGVSSWSVGHLKEQISILYPTKPKIEDQRLIYSGHLLKNEQILGDICDNDETSMTIHIVCNQKASAINSADSRKNDTAAVNSTIVNEASATTELNTNTLNNRNNLMNNVSPEMLMNFLSNNSQTLSSNNEQMMQQMALLQQMYLQYMTQYMNQNGFNSENQFQVPVFNPISTETNQGMPQVVANDTGVNGNVENMQNANNAPLARINAGAGAAAALAGEDDDDFRNRDWLDWFYWIARSMIFVTILYVYSSFSRFILVSGAALLLYLYQQGLLNGNERRRVDRRNPNQNNMNEEQLQQAMDGHVDPNTRQSRNADNNNNTTVEANEQNVQSGLKLAWLMVSSLFTSLLPQPPEPINLN